MPSINDAFEEIQAEMPKTPEDWKKFFRTNTGNHQRFARLLVAMVFWSGDNKATYLPYLMALVASTGDAIGCGVNADLGMIQPKATDSPQDILRKVQCMTKVSIGSPPATSVSEEQINAWAVEWADVSHSLDGPGCPGLCEEFDVSLDVSIE